MSIVKKDLGKLIDGIAENWLQIQSHAMNSKKHSNSSADIEHNTIFIHPISFLKYLLLQLNNGSKPSYQKLLEESYRYQRVPTQHVNDYCFARSLKYLCMDSDFRLSENNEPKPGNIVISATTKTYTRINWAICGDNGQLYQVNDLSDEIIISSLNDDNTLIHIIEIINLQLTISESIWSYYTSPHVRTELFS